MEEKIIFKTVNNDGDYSCGDIGVSVAEWYNLLLDKGASPFIDVLLCFLREPEHTCSCSEIAVKNGNSAQYYNSKVTSFSKWVQKKLNRFNVKGINGKDTFWCITMKKGWNTKQGFQWQMRDELVDALQKYLMHQLIQVYKLKEPFNGYEEEYKWALLDSVEGKDTQGIINCLRGINVVYNARVDGILKTLWESKPNELTACFNNLLDESKNLITRIEGFRDEMRDISPSEWNVCANDERTASAILTCRYPDKYTFYKSEVYQAICKYFGFECRSAYLKFAHFIDIINYFTTDFGEEIQQIMMPQIGIYRNKPLKLAVQTLFWCMKEEMKSDKHIQILDSNNQETIQVKKYPEYIDLLQNAHNLILTGAPGTGKTYLAKEIAKEMGAEFEFVQFHPSYDYTDFVEGLRPVKDVQNGVIGFKRQDGVFKKFCKKAILSESVDADTLEEINSNPNVWKVSLEGTGNNPTRTDCLNNGYIRIGWDKYGDVEDFNDYENFYDGGKNVLRAFQYGMQIGDLVVSCYSAKEIDAVGVIIGEYEYRPEGGEYPRYRNVKWLVKNIRENIVEINKNKPFTLSTIYKSNITAKDALEIVKKYSTRVAEVPRVDKAVFIIDEINRGEISKIFGELFFSIDPGYRGKAGIVKTQYQNMIEEGDAFEEGFYVPENVYILGTMNDIDRSVESMDFAMRRRFAWKEVSAEESQRMLDGMPYEAEAKARMNRLNDAILKIRGLGKAYQIGAAYFRKIKDYEGDFGKLWEYHLEGLLYEYLRGNNDASKQLEQLKNAYDGIE